MKHSDQPEEYATIIRQFRITAGVAMSILAGGAVFYHLVEKLSWLDSVYLCVITLTTIGYGDVAPKTDAGKLFTIFYVLVGVGIIAVFVNLLVKRAVVRRKQR